MSKKIGAYLFLCFALFSGQSLVAAEPVAVSYLAKTRAGYTLRLSKSSSPQIFKDQDTGKIVGALEITPLGATLTWQRGTLVLKGKKGSGFPLPLTVKSATRMVMDSSHLPSHLELIGPDKVIKKLPPKLKKLVSKEGSLTLGLGVKSRVEEWYSEGETLTSGGEEITVSKFDLQSPGDVAFVGLQVRELSLKRGRGKFFVRTLTVEKDAKLDVPDGSIFISELKASDGDFSTNSKAYTLLAAKVKRLDAVATDAAYFSNVIAAQLTAASESITAQDLEYDEATLTGDQVALAGGLVGHGAGLGVEAAQSLRVDSRLEGEASLSSKGHLLNVAGDFSNGTIVHIKGQDAWGVKLAKAPAGLTVEQDQIEDIKDWFVGEKVGGRESLTLIQTSAEPLALRGKKMGASVPHVTVATSGDLRVRGAFTGGDITLQSNTMDTEYSEVRVSGTYKREVTKDLRAVGEQVYADRIETTVGGNANFDLAHEEARQFFLRVTQELRAQGVYVKASGEGSSIDVLAGELRAEGIKEHQGNWLHEWDALVARPQFLCETGPLVLLAERGFWLEVPILEGNKVIFGSLQGKNANITPMVLTEVTRWREEHHKKGGLFRKGSTTVTQGESQSHTVVQPEIRSTGDLHTVAPEGEVHLGAAKVIVAHNWTVVAKKFGMEAATALHSLYSQSHHTAEGLLGQKTTTTSTFSSWAEETVPPIIEVGGNLYLYCEEGRLEAVQGFINGILENHTKKLTFPAHSVRQHAERHTNIRAPFSKVAHGSTYDRKDETPARLHIEGGIRSLQDSVIEIVGHEVTTNGKIDGEVIYREIERSEAFTSYAQAKGRNQAVLGVVVVASSLAAGVGGAALLANSSALLVAGGSAVAASAMGQLSAAILQDMRIHPGHFAANLGKAAAIAVVTAGVLDALELESAATGWEDHLQKTAVRQGVRATVNVACGAPVAEAVQHAAQGVCLDTAGAVIANELSDAYLPTALGKEGGLDYYTHKFLHGLLGAGRGALTDGSSGAVSAGVATIFAEMAGESLLGSELSIKQMALVAKLSGVAVGGLLGGNAQVASVAASNAVDHNFVQIAGAVAAAAVEAKTLAMVAGMAATVATMLKLAMDASPKEAGWTDSGFDPEVAEPSVLVTPYEPQGGSILWTPSGPVFSGLESFPVADVPDFSILTNTRPIEIKMFQNAKGEVPFKAWFDSLDKGFKQKIEAGLINVQNGNTNVLKRLPEHSGYLTEVKLCGNYRIYGVMKGDTYILLHGGSKDSQPKDIKKGMKMKEELTGAKAPTLEAWKKS